MPVRGTVGRKIGTNNRTLELTVAGNDTKRVEIDPVNCAVTLILNSNGNISSSTPSAILTADVVHLSGQPATSITIYR